MCDERLLKAIDANGPTGRDCCLIWMIQCDYRAKFQLQFPVFSSAGGSSHEEVVVGVRWRRWRLKCEDEDCVFVSIQRSLAKHCRACLENGKVDFLSYSY